MTLRALAAEAEAPLRNGPHPERARRDAETLLLHLLGQNRAWLLANWDTAASVETQAALRGLIARRSSGEPIQYITGAAEFFGLPFAVAPGVLIPRPETEHLVEEVLRLATQFASPAIHIADIGTGSGAIAVALAHSLPEAHISATDISPDALAVARANAAQNHVADRISFLEGDLLAPLKGRSFSIIASNPPYVPLRDSDSLSVEVREFEPHSALFAGQDGLNIYRRLIPEARGLLLAGGWLVMEIGFGQQEQIQKLMNENHYASVHFVPDYQGIPRVSVGRKL
ncbi:peptide chain release factor N(5)-glutamine methyltransferase [Acidicapsa acidisoli]|uniref:peptide chain release factor N(5)-glutamine methyltransferase n=1 Tax=Acidicapsa acidisoli TaxID=1615681 RepID=UPI0021E042CB|nr:peptide chain release factor N(5)-glutamine methyltransferase [Acidicapsa acidisoli]